MATDTAGRAAMHLNPMSHGEASSGDARKNKGRESMRDLDEKDAAHFAAQNPNIVPADTQKNVSFVNDGQGGFRPATNVNEGVQYQEQRLAKVNRKVADRSMESMDFVVHLPKSMCVEIPNFYPGVRDEKTGKMGKPRSRWVARDEEEAKRYLLDALEYLQQHVFPGGQASVAYFSIQFDESTPHIQGVSDVFDDDPKKPGTLRISGSRAYMSHRDVVYEHGPKKGKQISGQEKLRSYQSGLREHMISLGYPVEAEVSDRAHESFTKERYGEIMDRERELDEETNNTYMRSAELDETEELINTAAGEVKRLKEGAKSERAKAEKERAAAEQERQEAEEQRQEAQAQRQEAQRQAVRARVELKKAEEEARRARQEAQKAEQQRQEAEEQRQEAERQALWAREKAQGAEEEAKWWASDTARAELLNVALESGRDDMPQVDSNFLDEMLKNPKIRAAYDKYVNQNAKAWHVPPQVRDYQSRTVGENKEIAARRNRETTGQQQKGRQAGDYEHGF